MGILGLVNAKPVLTVSMSHHKLLVLISYRHVWGHTSLAPRNATQHHMGVGVRRLPADCPGKSYWSMTTEGMCDREE